MEFTIYRKDGIREIISGSNIWDAIDTANHAGEFINKKIDWYTDGVTETHKWDDKLNQWVKK